MASELHLIPPLPPFHIDGAEPEAINEQVYFDLNEPCGDIEEGFLFDLNREPTEAENNNEEATAQQRTTEMDTDLPQSASNNHRPKRNKLSSQKKMEILLWLLSRANQGVLERGSIMAAAAEFSCSTRTISALWNKAKQQRLANQRFDVSTKAHNSGRKRIEVPTDQIKALGMGDRSCIRDLAFKVNISKSSVHRMVQRGDIKPHTNPLHPGLTNASKIKRLEWILSLLQGDTPETKSEFYSMYDFVHIDEKWFYLSKKTQRIYLAHSERGPYRSASSSKFIPKVMFTAAVGRPRFNDEGECTFDGKIGIFPFTFQEPAKRKSKYRARGTLVTKLVESVNQTVTRNMLIHQIIPAIKEKWPKDGTSKVIFIQQDNAKAHIGQADAAWQQVYKQDGFTFILIQQPANSLDLNILDLGFFRSIQSLMHKKMPKDVDKMLDAVHEAFFQLQPKTLSNVWMSLQYVMLEVMKDKGGNSYDLPHVGKQRMQAEGTLHPQVKAPMGIVMDAWDLIHGNVDQDTQEMEATDVQDTQEPGSPTIALDGLEDDEF